MVRGVKHLRVDVGLLGSWIAYGYRADVTSVERYIYILYSQWVLRDISTIGGG